MNLLQQARAFVTKFKALFKIERNGIKMELNLR